LAAEPRIFCAEDLAHAAASQGIDDAVVRYCFAQHSHQHRKQLATGAQAARRSTTPKSLEDFLTTVATMPAEWREVVFELPLASQPRDRDSGDNCRQYRHRQPFRRRFHAGKFRHQRCRNFRRLSDVFLREGNTRYSRLFRLERIAWLAFVSHGHPMEERSRLVVQRQFARSEHPPPVNLFAWHF
jgi:hypothetical protein